jgi:hypothetical protein
MSMGGVENAGTGRRTWDCIVNGVFAGDGRPDAVTTSAYCKLTFGGRVIGPRCTCRTASRERDVSSRQHQALTTLPCSNLND